MRTTMHEASKGRKRGVSLHLRAPPCRASRARRAGFGWGRCACGLLLHSAFATFDTVQLSTHVRETA